MATPAFDPLDDGGLTPTDGPVPAAIEAASGANTWQGVAAWMDQQFEGAGATGNFAGAVQPATASTDGPRIVITQRPARPAPGDAPEAPTESR